MATEAEILKARRERAKKLEEAGVSLFPARVPRPLDRVPEVVRSHGPKDAEALEQEKHVVTVAGRIVSLRSFGKAAFLGLTNEGERLQVWMKRQSVGEEAYEEFKLYEVGDFMWARGALIRTKTGELTVDCESFGFLAKTYRPLPEKFHGLQDTEARYRQRYLDLLTNEDTRRTAVTSSRMISAIRRFLDDAGFLEVETPTLQAQYGGGHARPFETHHHTYDRALYLRISLELYLKRLVVGGIDRVYEIGRNFRNEGISKKHSPEFTMLEAYQAFADYEDMMDLVERLVGTAAERVLGTTRVERDGRTIELAPPWPRRPMRDLILEHSGIDLAEASTLAALRAALAERPVSGVEPAKAPTWGRLVDDVFSETVEPHLIDPVFVTAYPVELSPLAKRDADRPELVERFEAFVAGMEIANAFSELNDPDDQRVRFLGQVEAREAGDDEAQPLDEDFLLALEHGLPPTGGMGLGVGRLAMIFTGTSHLREVQLFPHLRPKE